MERLPKTVIHSVDLKQQFWLLAFSVEFYLTIFDVETVLPNLAN